MKNPWVLLLGLAVVYALSLFVYFSSFQNQAHRWHADKLFHLAGGFLIAALAASFFQTERWWVLGLAVLLVGIGWEALELFVNPWTYELTSPKEVLDMRDALGDIIGDVLGGFAFWITIAGLK